MSPWASMGLSLRGALIKSKSAAESWTRWVVASRRKGSIVLEVNYQLPFRNLLVQKDEGFFLPQPSALQLRILLSSRIWSSLFCLVLFLCVILTSFYNVTHTSPILILSTSSHVPVTSFTILLIFSHWTNDPNRIFDMNFIQHLWVVSLLKNHFDLYKWFDLQSLWNDYQLVNIHLLI